jgi:uncharacterized glyoxalase superfamily protein PhnB
MIVDDMPDMCRANYDSPNSIGGTSVFLHLYVGYVDLFNKGKAAGVTVHLHLMDAFCGYRYRQFIEPSGYIWEVAT